MMLTPTPQSRPRWEARQGHPHQQKALAAIFELQTGLCHRCLNDMGECSCWDEEEPEDGRLGCADRAGALRAEPVPVSGKAAHRMTQGEGE